MVDIITDEIKNKIAAIYNSGKSIHYVSRETGVSLWKTTCVINELGINRGKRILHKECKDKIIELYKNGESSYNIAKKVGASPGGVVYVLKKYGVERRINKPHSKSFINSLSSEELAYIAGFFDGEGCVVISKRKPYRDKKYTSYNLVTNISNTDKDVVDYIHSVIGGSIRENKKGKRYRVCYANVFSSEQSYQLLKYLLPYLKVRRKQAELAIKFQEVVNSSKNWKLTKEELYERDKIRQEIVELNSGWRKRLEEGGENSG